MAIGHVVTRGYGTGTLAGVIALVPTRGYLAGAAVVPVDTPGGAARRSRIFSDVSPPQRRERPRRRETRRVEPRIEPLAEPLPTFESIRRGLKGVRGLDQMRAEVCERVLEGHPFACFGTLFAVFAPTLVAEQEVAECAELAPVLEALARVRRDMALHFRALQRDMDATRLLVTLERDANQSLDPDDEIRLLLLLLLAEGEA